MSDDFSTRYRLLKCIAVDGGIRTHSAQALKTGRVVMVHVADAASPADVGRLRSQLERLNDVEKNRVMETATLASGFAIVTEFLTGVTSFPAWLAEQSGTAPVVVTPATGIPVVTGAHIVPPSLPTSSPAAPTAPPPAAPPSKAAVTGVPSAKAEEKAAPGAFTKLFMVGEPASPTSERPATSSGIAPSESPSVAAPPSIAPTSVTPSVTPAPSAPPGSFTKMFGIGTMSTGAESGSTPTPIKQAASIPLQPGTPSPFAASPPAASRPVASPPGVSPAASPPAASPPAASPPAAAAPSPAAPGAFTQMFVLGDKGKQEVPPTAPTPPVAAGPRSITVPVFNPVEATPVRPAAPPPTPPPTPISPPLMPPAASHGAGPGEFTKMFATKPKAAPSPSSLPSSHIGSGYGGPSSPPQGQDPSVSPLFGGHISAPSSVPVSPPPMVPPPMVPPPAPGTPSPALPPSHDAGAPSILPPPVFGSSGGVGSLSPLGGVAPSASAKAGPSDFTRMISTAPAPVVPTPKAAPTAMNVPVAQKKSIPMGLIIVINAVIILALIMVFMVLRRPGIPATPSAPTVTAPTVKPPTVTAPRVPGK